MPIEKLFASQKVDNLHATKLNIVKVDSNAIPAQAFDILIEKKIQSVPVYDLVAKKYSGFLDIRDLVSFSLFIHDNNVEAKTLLDIVNFGVKMFKHPTDVSITYLSRRNPFHSVVLGSPLLKVVEILSKGTHRVPIVDENNQLVDIISQSSIIGFINEKIGSDILPSLDSKLENLNDLGITNVTHASKSASAIDVFRLMDTQRRSGVAILDENNKLIGNTSSEDLKLFIHNPSPSILKLPIMEFLGKTRQLNDKPFIYCTLENTLKELIKKMVDSRIHRVFIVRQDMTLVKVISITDILRFILKKDNTN